MNENEKNDPHFDPAIQSEDIAFAPSELIDCSKCSRRNPPNRTSCLYCGNELDLELIDQDAIKPTIRPLEDWESGWNLIVLPQKDRDIDIENVSRILSMAPDEFGSIIESGVPMPIARFQNEAEARIVAERLAAAGCECSIVSDQSLDAETQPVRVRRLTIDGGRVTFSDFNTDKTYDAAADEIVLVVSGRLITGRTDILEKKKLLGRQSKILDEAHATKDEQVLDIYLRNDRRGFRIQSAGFDFTCLGEQMGLLVSENMRRLTSLLSEIAPESRLVEYDTGIRRSLELFWPTTAQKDKQGLVRSGFGKRDFGSAVTTSNRLQLTKFSRLQNTL